MIRSKLYLYVFKIRLFSIEINYVTAHVSLVCKHFTFCWNENILLGMFPYFMTISILFNQYCYNSVSREIFVYDFTMSNLVSVFPHALRHRIREKRIESKQFFFGSWEWESNVKNASHESIISSFKEFKISFNCQQWH